VENRIMGSWKDPASGEWLHTCTIITGEPNEFVREIHTRTPFILPEEQDDSWLTGEAGKEILVPYPADPGYGYGYGYGY
jgi:putative SOS response-associated peptidase YedK